MMQMDTFDLPRWLQDILVQSTSSDSAWESLVTYYRPLFYNMAVKDGIPRELP